MIRKVISVISGSSDKLASVSILLEHPLSVVQRAHLPGPEPSVYAVEVECVIAAPPRHSALLLEPRRLVGLAFDAHVHDMITADCTVVHLNVPSPHCHHRPFFDLEIDFEIFFSFTVSDFQ